MRILLAFTLSFFSLPAAAAQEAARPADGARRVDFFGDILVSDWLARLDNFAIELQNAPASKGYIVARPVPNSFPGYPLRRANWAAGYLLRGRGIGAGRVEVVNGGYADAIKFELWIAEPGASSPVAPFDLGAALSRERTPFLFDRFAYFKLSADDTGIESGYIGYLDEAGLYEPFVTALRSDPGARGCVIAYSGRRDRRGRDRLLAAQVKRAIMTTHAVGAGRIVPVAGGRRQRQTIELWIVPPGASLPTPTPSAAGGRRKR